MIPLGSPHVLPMGVHRTCGEPNEVELTPNGGGIERPTTLTELSAPWRPWRHERSQPFLIPSSLLVVFPSAATCVMDAV